MLPQTSVFLIFLLSFQIVYSVDRQCPKLVQGTNPILTHAHRIAKRSMPAALNFNEETFAAQARFQPGPGCGPGPMGSLGVSVFHKQQSNELNNRNT